MSDFEEDLRVVFLEVGLLEVVEGQGHLLEDVVPGKGSFEGLDTIF